MAEQKFITLDQVTAYKIASDLEDYVWNIVLRWEWFAKRTLGIQWTTSTDSIAGNIAEGFGRFHKKDKEKFYYNSRGSAYESAHWARKAAKRGLLTQDQKAHVEAELSKLPKEINLLIKLTEENLKK